MTHTEWEPTRYGGMRRRTRAAQTNGNPGLEVAHGAEAFARAGATDAATPGSTQVGHHSDEVKVGGSNPSPRTSLRKHPEHRKWAFRWRENLGLPDCPYVIRWRIETPWFSVRLHHWLGPDDDRAPHDHPWSFTTFVLKGGYTDMSPEGNEHLKAPAIRHRDATHRHTVVPDPGGAWTVIVTGPKVRTWGFWLNQKFYKANKWFASRGHHPCD